MSKPRAPARSPTSPAPGTLLMEAGRPPAGFVMVAWSVVFSWTSVLVPGRRADDPVPPVERCQLKSGPVLIAFLARYLSNQVAAWARIRASCVLEKLLSW